MSDVTISYKGADIATMDASGTKTLQTQGKYCEGDISVAYVKPSGGGTDFSSEWQRPSDWPALPNDVGTYSGQYYLYKVTQGITKYFTWSEGELFTVGTTDANGNYTALATFYRGSSRLVEFDISGLAIGSYFWVKGNVALNKNAALLLQPAIEAIVSNTNKIFYYGSTGMVVNANTIHLLAKAWYRNYLYDLDSLQSPLYQLQCVEFYDGSWQRPVALPINCNKIVINNVNIILSDGAIYCNNNGRGNSLYSHVNYGTFSRNNQTTLRLNACGASTEEIQSILYGFDNLSGFTNCYSLFYGAFKLKTIDFTGRKLTGVAIVMMMFAQCISLESVSWGETDFSNISSLESFADGCSSLISISIPGTTINISNSMNYGFRGCEHIKNIDLSNVTFTSSVPFTNTFSGCRELENLTFKQGAGIANNIYVGDSPLLTVESLVSLFNALATVTTARTVAIGATNKNKLSAEQKALATDKGWTIA